MLGKFFDFLFCTSVPSKEPSNRSVEDGYKDNTDNGNGKSISKPDKETLHDTLRLISAPVLADNRRSRIFNGRNWRSDRSAPVIGNAKSTDDIISVRRGETIDGDFSKREDKLSKEDREADFKGAMKDFLSEINLLNGEAEEIILYRKLDENIKG